MQFIFFENVCYAVYFLYCLLKCQDTYNVLLLYDSNIKTNILVRYMYLYVLDYLCTDYFYPYCYIIHIPFIYNNLCHVVLNNICDYIYDILIFLCRVLFILYFLIGIRLEPEMCKIDPKKMYLNITNIYNSDIDLCLYHCFFQVGIQITRYCHYKIYKILKYTYYYYHKFKYNSTPPLVTLSEYFTPIIQIGFYQNVIPTPEFAQYIVLLFPYILQFLIYQIYYHNVILCINTITYNYSPSVAWLFTHLYMYLTDIEQPWHVHYLRSAIGMLLPFPSILYLCINKEVFLFLETLWDKGCVKYNNKNQSLDWYDDTF